MRSPAERSIMKRVIKGVMTVIIVLAVAAGLLAVCFGVIDALHPIPKADKGRIRVACVGDSITYGCFLAGQPWNSYPKQLGRLLGDGYQVANFGYTNRTATKTADFPYTDEALYAKSLEFQPDIVLIMLGSNDSKPYNWDPEAYRRDMTDLIDSYLELETQPQVAVMIPPPAFEVRGRVMWDIRADVIENEIRPICREIAEEKGIKLIDTYTPFVGQSRLFVDGVHPTPKGGAVLAQTVYEAIAE